MVKISINKEGQKNSAKKYILSASGIYPFFLICLAGLVIYSNSFDCSFHFDNNTIIVENSAIRNSKDLRAIWNFVNRRFIGTLTFSLNYHFSKLDVFSYHAVNLLIHVTSSLMVYWLTVLILSSPAMKKEKSSKYRQIIPLGCSLIFLAHPLQTQAVTYIVQRYASLAALFYLTSLCLYMKARLSKTEPIRIMCISGMAISALLGMFTKETAYTLPMAVLLLEYCFLRPGTVKHFLSKRIILIFSISFMVFAFIILGLFSFDFGIFFKPVESSLSSDPQLTNRIYLLTQFRVIATYLRLLFLPIYQNLDYDYPASLSLFKLPVLASLLLITVIVSFAIRIFRRNKLITAGILWFFLTLSVESGIIPINDVIYEHRLYLPMFGFTLFFMGSLTELFRYKSGPVTAILAISVISCS